MRLAQHNQLIFHLQGLSLNMQHKFNKCLSTEDHHKDKDEC